MKVNFSKKIFSPKFLPHLEQSYNYEVYYGGAGSGKSVFIAQKLLYKCLKDKYFRFIYSRKVKEDIRDSTFLLLKDLIKRYNLDPLFHIKETTMDIICVNGNSLHAFGCEDPDRVKSFAEPTGIWFEEITQYEDSDFNEIDLRLRGKKGVQLTTIASFNPVVVSHWVKSYLVDSPLPNSNILHSTYIHNPFIDQEAYEIRLNRLEKFDPNRYRVMKFGDWGVEDVNKLFARDFRREKHVTSENNYNPNLDIYLCFDLNYDPTCLVIQFDEKGIYVLREYHIEGYTLPMILELIKVDYPASWPQVYVINGDVSGEHSRNISDNTTSYELIKDSLFLSWDNFHVPSHNPSHLSSRLLCNLAFKCWNILIHSSCTELISDLEQVEVDNKGSLDPYKRENPKRSHWLDSLRYHINYEHADLPKKLGISDFVKT